MELTIEQVLQRAVVAHKEGKLQEAEHFYRTILKSQPSHPDAITTLVYWHSQLIKLRKRYHYLKLL